MRFLLHILKSSRKIWSELSQGLQFFLMILAKLLVIYLINYVSNVQDYLLVNPVNQSI
jgi:hypothetical protein